MDVDFEMFAARNGKKFQKISSLENQKKLNKIFVVLINWLATMKENSKLELIILLRILSFAKNRSLKKHLKEIKNKNRYKENIRYIKI